MAAKILRSAPAELLLHHKPGDFLPNVLEDFNDLAEVSASSHFEFIFGPNYDRLRRLKTKYDPDSRFNKGFFIPPFIKSDGS
jgi:FAD/FMN-containing dehydrogenase